MDDKGLEKYRREWFAELDIEKEVVDLLCSMSLGNVSYNDIIEYVNSFVGDYAHSEAMVSYLML